MTPPSPEAQAPGPSHLASPTSAAAPASTLAVTSLTRSYPDAATGRWATVLHGVDLTVRAGENLALLGRSGCGKTTLLRALLLLDAPGPEDTGQVLLDDAPVAQRGPLGGLPSARSLRPYRRAVQYVPQDPAASLDPRHDVLSQVTRPLATLGAPGGPEEHRATAETLLEALDLPRPTWTHRPHEVSGGQAQRLAIARALAPRPSFLLLDEPVSGLDPALRHQVLDLLAGLRDEPTAGLCLPGGAPAPTLLVVSHDLAAVARVCGRSVVMEAGRLVEDVPTAQLLATPTHPAARALRDAVPTLPAD